MSALHISRGSFAKVMSVSVAQRTACDVQLRGRSESYVAFTAFTFIKLFIDSPRPHFEARA